MSIFSLNWFKSKKKKEVVEEEMFIEKQPVQEPTYEKPYVSLKLVNDTLTVVLRDGSVISKPSATANDFTMARLAVNEEDILNIVLSKEVYEEKKKKQAEIERVQKIVDGIEVLKQIDDFVVDGSSVYLKGIPRTLPQILVEEFISIVKDNEVDEDMLAEDEHYQALKRFFMWCCLNPRAEVADKLYAFLMKNSFRITKQGFFVALRNVVTVEKTTDNTLVHFISNAYNKVKAVWKKNPDNYKVEQLENGDYKFAKLTSAPEGALLGNLSALYKDLPNMVENRFTDHYTQTFDIRLGKPVNMPPEECSWSTQDCAEAGLHFTSDQIHYVGCGDTSVLILINPMKVVGIGEHKGRCYEYLPIMTVPRDEATEILHDLDFDTLELDEDYAIRELEGLTEKVKEGFVAEAKKYSFNMPSISTEQINSIVISLNEMRYSISKRVSIID